ncbi:MAG: hypothetical protein A6D91_11120 [Bacillaceae bacterium G1]|nr:MAG: hypothetical protein A6D91_11120 [Bacillaceae bacterium G1]
MEWLWWLIIVAFFGLSFVGLFVPVIPSTPLVLLGFLVYRLLIGDVFLGWGFWLTMVLLTVFSFVVDYVASGVLVKRSGGSKAAVWSAVLGAMVGPFVFGPLGLFVGPFLAVVAVEWLRQQNLSRAVRVGGASLVGLVGGSLFRGLLHLVMIVWFLLVVF